MSDMRNRIQRLEARLQPNQGELAAALHAYYTRRELPNDPEFAAFVKETSERIQEECRLMRATVPEAPEPEQS